MNAKSVDFFDQQKNVYPSPIGETGCRHFYDIDFGKSNIFVGKLEIALMVKFQMAD